MTDRQALDPAAPVSTASSAAPASALRLSPAQLRVIRHRGGHLQVIACAGSGKTETVARRVAELVAEGVAPSGIVAFTFTNAAADALKARIHARVVERLPGFALDRLSPMYVGTIHAFCLRFLQENCPRYSTFDLFEGHQIVALLLREYSRIGLDRLAEELGVSNRAQVVQLFLQSADVVDNELIDPAKLPGGAFRDAYGAYLDALEGYHVLTHNQCIARAVSSLDEPAVFERCHAGLKHLLVDEFQDINPAQAALIERLGRRPVEVCVVGDDDQSIYQWRGSSVGYLQAFQARFKAVSESLDVNRRSAAGIVALAAQFAETIDVRIPKSVSASRPAGEFEVHRFVAPDAATEAELVADAIARMNARGTKLSSVAVLLRSVATSSRPFIEALERRGIPWRCVGTTGLFLQPDAKALAKAFHLLGGRERYYDARAREYEPADLGTVAGELAEAFDVPEPAVRAWLKRTQAAIPGLKSVDLVGTLYELLSVLRVSALDPADSADGCRLATVARFSELLADFESASRRLRRVHASGKASGAGTEVRGASSSAEWAFKRCADFIGFYGQSAYEDGEDPLGFDVDAVTITTVHQAKGLEWPVIFVPCLSAGRFPSRQTGKERRWLLPRTMFNAVRYEGTEEDERRLMYVAVTRARDHLFLSTHDAVTTRRAKWSPFFEELGGGSVKSSKAPVRIPARPAPAVKAEDEKPTLSLSEVATWLQCPMAYRLRLELGFQPRAAKELGYGKAVHHVLRRIAEETQRTGRVPTPAAIGALFDREFFLPYADKPSLAVMRRAAERLVRRYVEDHSHDLRATWSVERAFELHLPEANITGRADVIVKQGVGLTLVDYKTKTGAGSDALFATQLSVYAAAGVGEGLDVQRAYLHDLSREGAAARVEVAIDAAARARATQEVRRAVRGIRQRQFPAKPGDGCGRCDVQAVCAACPAGRRG